MRPNRPKVKEKEMIWCLVTTSSRRLVKGNWRIEEYTNRCRWVPACVYKNHKFSRIDCAFGGAFSLPECIRLLRSHPHLLIEPIRLKNIKTKMIMPASLFSLDSVDSLKGVSNNKLINFKSDVFP